MGRVQPRHGVIIMDYIAHPNGWHEPIREHTNTGLPVAVKRRKQTILAFERTTAGRDAAERNDCAVRALAVATPWTYAETHKLLQAAGRQDRKGFHLTAWLRHEVKTVINGVRFVLVFDWLETSKTYTLGQFLKTKPAGNYIVVVSQHAFAVCDGIVKDINYNGPRRRLQKIYRVELA
jgi:hypothetical protein